MSELILDVYTCTRCKQVRTHTEMGKDSARKDGVDSWCKRCKVEDEQRRQQIRHAILQHVKELFPCEDCNLNFPHYIMEWDHVREAARRQPWHFNPWKWILEEMGKCDLVCANCHRTRTWMRLQDV